MQHKLSEGNLVDMEGNLTEAGYATRHIKAYNRKNVDAHPTRIKEWDYYYVHNSTYGVGLTIADNGYMGLVSLVIIDFDNHSMMQETKMTWFPLGKMNLPCTPEAGKTTFNKKGVTLNLDYGKSVTHVKIHWENFREKKPVEIDLKLTDKPRDSIVLTVPFDKPNQFYYNQKTYGMRCEGTLSYLHKTVRFDKHDTFALLDFGRGVWPYKSEWYWGAAQGMQDDALLAFNIGGGFGNTNQASEDMIFHNGKGHKLSKGHFELAFRDNGRPDYMKPWRYRTEDGRLDVTFTPSLRRHDATNFIVLKNTQNQIFGHYDGKAELDDGTIIDIEALPGFAEHFVNKW